MALALYKAVADIGGAKGDQIASGIRGALLPDLTASERLSGIEIFRKFYIENTGTTISLQTALDQVGEFDGCIFLSTGDAQVVGNITGSEPRYGASEITALEDSGTLTETVNGAGGLADIKKIKVKDNQNFTLFRVADKVGIGGPNGQIGIIETIVDLGAELEITLQTPLTYTLAIGMNAHSYIETSILTDAHESFWVEVKVEPNASTSSTFNALSLALVY